MKILWLSCDEHSSDIMFLKSKYEYIVSSRAVDDITNDYQLVIVSNYDQIIPEEYFKLPRYGVVVIHSSDLPKGRGWAPIYNSIYNKEIDYVISLIKIDKKVDAGNMLLKIRVKKPQYIDNNNLRKIDEEAIIVLVEKFLEIIKKNKKKLVGQKQNNTLSTYFSKREVDQNKIDENKSIKEQIHKILATNKSYASFIEIDGERIEILASNTKKYTLKDLMYTVENFIK